MSDRAERRWTLYETGPDTLKVQGPGIEEESALVMLVAEHEDALDALREERDNWKRAVNGDRDGLVTHAYHLRVIEVLVAERKAAEQKLEEVREEREEALKASDRRIPPGLYQLAVDRAERAERWLDWVRTAVEQDRIHGTDTAYDVVVAQWEELGTPTRIEPLDVIDLRKPPREEKP